MRNLIITTCAASAMLMLAGSALAQGRSGGHAGGAPFGTGSFGGSAVGAPTTPASGGSSFGQGVRDTARTNNQSSNANAQATANANGNSALTTNTTDAAHTTG